MTLKEAIDRMQRRADDELDCDDLVAYRILLAAARAFACETCGATGMVLLGFTQCNGITEENWTICPACAADRKLARGE